MVKNVMELMPRKTLNSKYIVDKNRMATINPGPG